MEKVIIGVTDCGKFDNYSNWILNHGSDIEVIKLSEKNQNYKDVERCHGVLFSGGEDVHPGYYNKPEYLAYCHKDDVNPLRDEFEFKLMEYTEQNKIPVLGICRGLQIFNVFMKGTLIPDIPSWDKPLHSKLDDGSDRHHAINVMPNSWLFSLVKKSNGQINSNHHQSIDRIGKDLIVCGLSDDDIVEAVERKNQMDKGYLCLVQWHPERMKDQGSSFVLPIRQSFIEAARNQ